MLCVHVKYAAKLWYASLGLGYLIAKVLERMANDTKGPTDLGAAETLATGSATPSASVAALDQTLASDGAQPKPSAVPVIVRAGHPDNDLDFATIDPQRYGVSREIARGGMGRIMAARDRRLGRPVAIKELLTASGDLRGRFEREARITARLQHPSIVNLLEAGTWPGGEPFYVMKLVAGDSLDKVIAQRPTLEARLALLPNVIAAVDALAYAHSLRVIHRDLKPANVLVGEFGETVVIDWGLAKDLADTSGAPDVTFGPYTTPTVPGQTEAGTVMGTPAYMPKEQAEGDAVDERADVYALGAMLYHTLAGAPPYTGKTAETILDAVIAGPPPPLDARTSGVPPDLVTIVTKAMAHAPADRYPTAKQLAEDLKKFQTGQLVVAHNYSARQLLRRWIRRHRTAVIVAAVAIVLLGVLGVVSVRRIVGEQARTEQKRRDAVALMSFMLGDLRDKLEPLGKLDLLESVAEKARAYYEDRHATDDPEEQRLHAVALNNLGDVLATRDAPGALARYREALAMAEDLVARKPDDVAVLRMIAMGYGRIGKVLVAQGDMNAALVAYRAAVTAYERLVAVDPSDVEQQRGLWVAQARIGNLLERRGDAVGALASYRKTQVIVERLAGEAPDNFDRQRDVAVIHEWIGDALLAQGDVRGALTSAQAALGIRVAFAAHVPDDASAQHDLSISHEKVADVLLVQKNMPAAVGEYRAELAIAEKLIIRDPANARWQRDQAVTLAKIGTVLQAQGEAAAALASYRASLAISEKLLVQDPTNADWNGDARETRKRIENCCDPAKAL